MTMQGFVRRTCTMIAAPVQRDVDGVSKVSHFARVPGWVRRPRLAPIPEGFPSAWPLLGESQEERVEARRLVTRPMGFEPPTLGLEVRGERIFDLCRYFSMGAFSLLSRRLEGLGFINTSQRFSCSCVKAVLRPRRRDRHSGLGPGPRYGSQAASRSRASAVPFTTSAQPLCSLSSCG